MDVADSESIAQGFDAAEAAFGTVTVVSNNAGVADVKSSLKTDEASWDKVVVIPTLKACGWWRNEAAKRLVACGPGGQYCQYGVDIGSAGCLGSGRSTQPRKPV